LAYALNPIAILITGYHGQFDALMVAPAFLAWPNDVADNFVRYTSWYGQWGYPLVYMLGAFLRSGTVPEPLPDPDNVSLVLPAVDRAVRPGGG
jgi:hypothetical protein